MDNKLYKDIGIVNNLDTWNQSEPDIHWPTSITNVYDKTILDLGCGSDGYKDQEPWISTVEYWLLRGAKKIIGIEANSKDAEYLNNKFSKLDGKVKVINDSIQSSTQIQNLINEYDIQIVKSDIESFEYHFLDVDDSSFSKIDEYYIETHDDIDESIEQSIYGKLVDKFEKCGYSIVYAMQFEYTPTTSIIKGQYLQGEEKIWKIRLLFAHKNKNL